MTGELNKSYNGGGALSYTLPNIVHISEAIQMEEIIHEDLLHRSKFYVRFNQWVQLLEPPYPVVQIQQKLWYLLVLLGCQFFVRTLKSSILNLSQRLQKSSFYHQFWVGVLLENLDEDLLLDENSVSFGSLLVAEWVREEI